MGKMILFGFFLDSLSRVTFESQIVEYLRGAQRLKLTFSLQAKYLVKSILVFHYALQPSLSESYSVIFGHGRVVRQIDHWISTGRR